MITSLSLLSLGATGCIYDEAESTAPSSEGEVTVRLRLSMANIFDTRSDNHPLEPGTAAESYIDLTHGDFSIAIFRENAEFVTRVTPSTYTVSDNLYYVEGILSKEIKESIGERFVMMVLANWTGYDGSLYPGSYAEGIPTLAGSNGVYNFTHQAYLADGTTTWHPDIEEHRLIPMFGMAEGDFSEAVQDSEGKNRLSLTVPMLRALAKVEIIDNTPGLNSITGVTMTRVNTGGRFIPDISANPNWNGSSQVTTPSLPAGVNEQANLRFINLPRTINGKTHNVWTAYIPEMILGTGTQIADDRPCMKVNVAYAGQTLEYPLHFAQYAADGTVSLPNNTSWNYILRNHIYSYEVNSLNVTANLTLNVLPWDVVEDEPWDYTENVIIEEGNFLTWHEETILNDNKREGIVTLQGSRDAVAVADFMISAPKNGTWYATLQPLTGPMDAFYFVDEEGNEIASPSGNVGEDATLRIKVRRETVTDNDNTAKLIIMVRSFDGRWMEAELCEGAPTHYIINQNRTNF